jgi:adenosylcobinamide-GDP ribazoletransferase
MSAAARSSLLADFHLALVFMTRLPLPPLTTVEPGGLARAMRLFPLVGLIVGAIGAAAYALAHLVLPAHIAAVIAIAAIIAVTGSLHEDGLADVADGFGGGGDKARKLEIMRDSRIGTYGLVVVVLGLLLRVGALADLNDSVAVAVTLIAAHTLSRALIPAVMLALPPARADGLGAGAGQPDPAVVGIAATLALLIAAAILTPAAAAAAVAGATAGAAAVALLARRHIGGQTGDVLGAVEQAAQTAAMLAVLAVVS